MKKGLLVLMLAAYAPALIAQGTPNPQAFSQNKRAQVYYYFSLARLADEQGKLDEAISQYKKALELDPTSSALYSEMADTYSRNGKIKEAEAAADKAIANDRDNIAAHKLLFTLYTSILNRRPQAPDAEMQTAIQRAIIECEEIIRIDPSETQYYLMLGRFYQFQSKPDKEAEVYKKLLGIEPGSEEGVMALAELHLNANNGKEAAALLERFLKANPEADSAWHTLGDAHVADRDFAKAAEAYKRAVDLNPADADHLQAYAEALYSADKFDEAVKVYQQLAKDSVDDANATVAVMLRLGQIYRRQAKYDQARSSLEKAAGVAPDNLEIQFNLALVDRDDGRLEDALKRLNTLVDRTTSRSGRPSPPAELQSRSIFLTYVATLNSTLGRYDEAIRRFTELRGISPEKDRIDSYIVDTYRTAKNLDKALEYSETALTQTPNSRELQVAHADIIAEKGRVDEAIKALDKLTKNTDEDIDVLSAMVNIYERANKFSDAQKLLETMIKRFPDEYQVYFLQGAVYAKQKKYSDAEKSFQKALDIDKDNSQVLNYLGYMLADNGTKLENALEMIQKAVNQDPANGAYLDSLGWVYFKLNRLDLAEQYLKKAVRFVNFDSDIHDHLGELFYKTGRYEEALDSWTKSLQFATEPEDQEKLRKKLNEAKSKIAKK